MFDFELVDTSLEAQSGPKPEEQERLARAAEQIRTGLAQSGKFQVLDISPVREEARRANLQACGGCDVELARRLGADLAITGVVQKVSNLILNMNIYVKDAHTGQPVTGMSADFRGNTDESWSRTARYLLRNRLLQPDYGARH